MRARLAPPLALAAAAVILYWPLWTDFPFSQGDDALEYALPFGAFVGDSFREGWVPLWNPYLNGGAPLFVQTPYMGPFYPLFGLFLATTPERAVAVGFAAHLLLAALLAYGFARSAGVGRLGAFVAGFLWATASPLAVDWTRGYLPNLVGKAYLPALWWTIEHQRRTGRMAGPLAAAAFVLALVFLGGHLTEAPMILAAFGVYALVAASPRSPRRAAGLWATALLAPPLAAAAAAAYHLPLYEAIQASPWTGGREPLAEAIYRPWEALRFFAPGMERGDTLALYAGVAPWLLAAAGLRRLGARAAPALAAAAVGLVLMPGDAGGLFRLLRAYVPMFDIVTYTSMFQAPVVLAVALLAGAGVDRLGSGVLAVRTRHRLTLVAIAMIAANAALGWGLHAADGVPFRVRRLAEWNVSVPVLYAAILIFLMLLHLLARRPRMLAAVAALCCALDLALYEIVLLVQAPRDPPPYASALALPEIKGREPPDRRLFGYEIRRPERAWRLRRNQGMIDRIPEVVVSAKVTDLRYAWIAARFTHVALDREVIASQNAIEGVPLVPRPTRLDWDVLPDRVWLEILGVRYVLTDLPVYGDRVVMLEDGGDWGLYEVPPGYRDALPLRPPPLPSRPGDLLDPEVAARDWWPDGERLIEGPEPYPEAPAVLRAARGREAGPNGYIYDLQIARAGFFPLPIRYAPGWRARIDGAPAPLYLYDLLFMGVNAPEGGHRLSLSFDPTSFRLGAMLSVTSLTLIALLPTAAALARAGRGGRRTRGA